MFDCFRSGPILFICAQRHLNAKSSLIFSRKDGVANSYPQSFLNVSARRRHLLFILILPLKRLDLVILKFLYL